MKYKNGGEIAVLDPVVWFIRRHFKGGRWMIQVKEPAPNYVVCVFVCVCMHTCMCGSFFYNSEKNALKNNKVSPKK